MGRVRAIDEHVQRQIVEIFNVDGVRCLLYQTFSGGT